MSANKFSQDALEPMLDQLDEQGRTPETLHADGGYGRDGNVVGADSRGVDLQSPAAGNPPQNDTLTVDDFAIDEASETVERCPAGRLPESSVYDSEKGRTRTVMSACKKPTHSKRTTRFAPEASRSTAD